MKFNMYVKNIKNLQFKNYIFKICSNVNFLSGQMLSNSFTPMFCLVDEKIKWKGKHIFLLSLRCKKELEISHFSFSILSCSEGEKRKIFSLDVNLLLFGRAGQQKWGKEGFLVNAFAVPILLINSMLLGRNKTTKNKFIVYPIGL